MAPKFAYRSEECKKPWSRLGADGKNQLDGNLEHLPLPSDPKTRSRLNMSTVCQVPVAAGLRDITVEYDYKRRLRFMHTFTVRCLVDELST